MTLLFVVLCIGAPAQTKKDAITGWEHTICGQTAALYPGGEKALVRYLKKSITDHPFIKKEAIEGKALIRFKIDTSGAIAETKMIKSLGPDVDAVIIRAVASMKPWIPATQSGIKVFSYKTLPVLFK
nr:energy transducer TonB [Niabella beijingensis]